LPREVYPGYGEKGFESQAQAKRKKTRMLEGCAGRLRGRSGAGFDAKLIILRTGEGTVDHHAGR
jgi:hypothetical protein